MCAFERSEKGMEFIMKQIEITVRLDENMQSAIMKLEKQGFKK